MYASSQCPPCHALINCQHIYEPLNQSNSLPTGSSWLQDRQNRFGRNFRRGRLYSSRRVLLCDTWKQLLMYGIELHCHTLILLCTAPDDSKLYGVVPVAKQCDPKQKILEPLRRRSCEKGIYLSVAITSSHRRSPWYAMDRGKRLYTFWHKHERTRVFHY
jgi:hypothetical protein